MEIFGASVTAFRDPRAHKIIDYDPEQALEIIAFISFLTKRVEKSKKQMNSV